MTDVSAPVAPHVAADPLTSPRRLHPVSPFFDFLLVARQLLVPAVVTLNTGGTRLLLFGVVAVLGLRVLAWWRRTYALVDGVLRVDSGVLARKAQLVPAERIQQVNALRKLRHRVLGVVTLQVETAGGGGTIELEVLGEAAAAGLRSRLLAAKAAVIPVPTGDPGPAGVDAPPLVPTAWPVVRLGVGDLALAGLTGSSLLVVFAFVGSLLNLVDDLPGSPFDGLEPPSLDPSDPATFAGAVLVFLVVWLGSAAGTSVLRDFGYDLSLVGDELHVRRGLLDSREAVLPLARIQTVRISSSALRRPLGLVSLRFTSAGARDKEDGRVVVPLLRRREVDRVLRLVLPAAAPLPELARPPRVAMRRAVVRRVVPATVVAVPVAVLAWPRGALALVLVPLAAAAGVAVYRGLGSALRGGVLYARSGALGRTTVVVPTVRAQSASARSTYFQRRLGLATLAVDVAGPGGTPRVVDESAATVADLAERTVGSGSRT